MPAPITLTLPQARALMLAAQGLLTPPAAPAVKANVLSAIRRMGALQIDTINVVARSPYFVLFSRLGSYDLRWLDDLLAEGHLFEYWSHAACFLPIEDYPLYRHIMLHDLKGWFVTWIQTHPDVVNMVLERITAEGALRSADFKAEKPQPGGWWNWKQEKIALEQLFTSGKLMVDRRVNFQRVYNLRERVLPKQLPAWDETQVPSHEETNNTLILRSVQALGFARAAWVADYFRLPKRGIAEQLASLEQAGLLNLVEVQGLEGPIYTHPGQATLVEQAAAGALQPTHTTLLSPFDPLTWDRARARQLFGFNYTIETYIPREKRVFGYFTLPILHRDAVIGRLAPKTHRSQKLFEVRNLVVEPGVEVTGELAASVGAAIQQCAAWHACPQVSITQSDIPAAALGL